MLFTHELNSAPGQSSIVAAFLSVNVYIVPSLKLPLTNRLPSAAGSTSAATASAGLIVNSVAGSSDAGSMNWLKAILILLPGSVAPVIPASLSALVVKLVWVWSSTDGAPSGCDLPH